MPIDTIAKKTLFDYVRGCLRVTTTTSTTSLRITISQKKIVLELKRVFRILIFGEKKWEEKMQSQLSVKPPQTFICCYTKSGLMKPTKNYFICILRRLTTSTIRHRFVVITRSDNWTNILSLRVTMYRYPKQHQQKHSCVCAVIST